MSLGRRIYKGVTRPDRTIVELFSDCNSADISDVMHQAQTMDRAIQPAYQPIPRIVGPAVTVSVPTGAQNVRKMAMAQTQPGDVLVMNGWGCLQYGLLGGNLGRGLLHRGVAGVVIDGAFRDLTEFREMSLPVFARGRATLGGPKEGTGEVNVPIACGGVVVFPGDIIVADEDGIAVVPPAYAEEISSGIARLKESHASRQAALRSGDITDVDAIEEGLRAAGWQLLDRPFEA